MALQQKSPLSLAHLWLVIAVLLHLAQLDNVYLHLSKRFGIHHWVGKAGLPGFLPHLHRPLVVPRQSGSVHRTLKADHPLPWQSCSPGQARTASQNKPLWMSRKTMILGSWKCFQERRENKMLHLTELRWMMTSADPAFQKRKKKEKKEKLFTNYSSF